MSSNDYNDGEHSYTPSTTVVNNRHHLPSLRASCPALPSNSPTRQSAWSYSYSPPGLKSLNPNNNNSNSFGTSLSTSFSTTGLRYLTDFEELKDVGKGSFGTVVKVKNRLDERDYAVKKIRLSRRNDSTFNKKILREVSALSRVSHENVVRYYQAWIEDGPPNQEEGRTDEEEDDEGSFSGSNSNNRRGMSMDEEEEEERDEDEDGNEEDVDEEGCNENFMDSSTGEDGELFENDSLEDLVAGPVFEGEDVNCDPAIFSSHFDLPKGRRGFRSRSSNSKRQTTSQMRKMVLAKKKGKRKMSNSNKAETEQQQKLQQRKDHSSMTSVTSSLEDDDESSRCWCNLCGEGYRDWEVSFADWKDKQASLQPMSVCQICYTHQLRKAGLDISTLSLALKPELKRFQYLYIQMEYCHFSLREIINNKTLFERGRDEMWRLFRQIAEGLAHIHSQGIIHRDLKPDNVFITIDANNELKMKIGDFGLATSITDIVKNGAHRRGGEMTGKVGTYLYSSPEMVSLSRSGYDEKVDIYALGIIFFEMCHPFSTGMERCKVLEALRNHLAFPVDFERNPANEQQVHLIRWMLQRDPRERPSAHELLKNLPLVSKGRALSRGGSPLAHEDISLPVSSCSTLSESACLRLQTTPPKVSCCTRQPVVAHHPHPSFLHSSSTSSLALEALQQSAVIKSLEARCLEQQKEIEQLREQLSLQLQLQLLQKQPTPTTTPRSPRFA